MDALLSSGLDVYIKLLKIHKGKVPSGRCGGKRGNVFVVNPITPVQ